jgi:hypothetical protein
MSGIVALVLERFVDLNCNFYTVIDMGSILTVVFMLSKESADNFAR